MHFAKRLEILMIKQQENEHDRGGNDSQAPEGAIQKKLARIKILKSSIAIAFQIDTKRS